MSEIKLTEYSHGSGCGCKISPSQLEKILAGIKLGASFSDLLVGNDHNDDAAVISIDDQRAIISTTDFFMPIVDDPYDFGRIAATNAISDIYAMGGKPLMAISIFGWPLDKLPVEVGNKVIEGGKKVCEEAGIPLAGGHSIDSPEPIFGLAVTGIIDKVNLKTNDGAKPGNKIFLTKPLGIGVLTTAEKKKVLKTKDRLVATKLMLKSNSIGMELAQLPGVTALTDVTGFGLLGHLKELCEASNVRAEINSKKVPVISDINYYLDKGCVPGGTLRNFTSYGSKISHLSDYQKHILCDPQTSGGLLVTVDENALPEFKAICSEHNLALESCGIIKAQGQQVIEVF